MKMRNILKKLALISVLVTATLMAQTPYEEGQKALREQRWMDAARQFEEAAKSDKEQADAAIYWRAYAYYKASRDNEAERELRRLERKYPQSQWIKEAHALRIENQNSEQTISQMTSNGEALDEDLRLFALAQLIDTDPQRAMPLVLDLVRNSESESVRQDALFVLALSDDPAAQQAIAQIAKESAEPELQVSAIHILGSTGTESSLALLAELYTGSASKDVKRAVIHAHIAGDDAAPLVSMYQSEKDSSLQREIIHALGAMDATSELQSLYPTLDNEEDRIAAIEAFAIAGDNAMLRQTLETETDPDIRRSAILGIAMAGNGDTAETLQSIYNSTNSDEEKSSVLEALTMTDDAQDLVMQIIASEQNPELQRKAIHLLGIMDGTAELGELYRSLEDPESRRAVLEAMSIADDSSGLLQVLETEQNPQLRADAIHSLGIAGDQAAADTLSSIYPGASREEKSAVIESMMIMENTQALIGLLKQEDDPDLKREMLQMLTIIDSEESRQYLFELLEQEG
jgi:HEAT repeat protein